MVRHLALGNGSMLVNLDENLRIRDLYFPQAGLENHVLGKELRIGVKAKGFSWLREWDTKPGYKNATIVTESKAANKLEDLEITFESCVHCKENVFLRKITVKNNAKYDREVEMFFEQDFDMYGNGVGDTAAYRPEENGIVHYKQNRYAMINLKKENGSCSDLDQYGIYNDDPRAELEAGDLNMNPISQGNVRSAVSIKLDIEPEGEKTFYYWINTGEDFDEVRKHNSEVKEEIEGFFEHTAQCWRGYLGKLDCDTDMLDQHIENQLKRSILIIRAETNDNGAITAANDSENLEFNQDKYGYVWPRDGALVAETMAKAGYSNLVKPFFDLMEEKIEEEGYLLHKYNPDGSLGSSWHPWIGEDGRRQLPIQEDETALVIWALNEYSKAENKREILEEKWNTLVKPAADFMYDYFNEDLHLPKPSYDLWEEKRYISTFTVASVYAGLKAAGKIAEKIGEDEKKFFERAEEIKEEGLENLRSEETLRYGRGIEDGELIDQVSAPLIFLEKLGLTDSSDEYFENTINAIRYDLSPDTDIGGIARYRGDYYHNVTEDFDKVPGNPWIICTLWLAEYLIDEAETQEELEKAKKYMHWTCENSLETGVLPEQVDPFTGEGKSVAPLTWSHSTFIETALKYAEKKEELT